MRYLSKEFLLNHLRPIGVDVVRSGRVADICALEEDLHQQRPVLSVLFCEGLNALVESVVCVLCDL